MNIDEFNRLWEEYGKKCKSCKHNVNDRESEYNCSCMCEKHEMYEPKSNYDIFMSMGVEEFARYIECPYTRGDPYGECKFGWHERTQTCLECIIEWLNSPMEEKYYELNEDE